MKDRVCAVIVTHNRKALLREALEALRQQSYPTSSILIVDNASTDGTEKMLRDDGLIGRADVEYLKLERNSGGAGGFHAGFERAHGAGYDWIWAMDDDTIAAPDALEQLLSAYAQFQRSEAPDLLSSRALWTDGSPHPMNVPWPETLDAAKLARAARHGLSAIRAATFVSMLLHRSVVETYGLPIADYFIWSDDIEYSGRVLRRGFGVAVPASIVVHKTAHTRTALEAPPERAFYHVRNTLWMVTRSRAWRASERWRQLWSLLIWMPAYIKRAGWTWNAVAAVARAAWKGVLGRPLR